MNWKYLVGSGANIAVQTVLSSSLFPLTPYLGKGRNWIFDAQLFAGTRNFSIAFDVGANIGQTAWGLVRYLKSAQLYCFEPVRSTFDILAESYGKHQNVHCVNQAFGSAPGSATIALHDNSELNTLVASGPRNEDLTDKTETITLDTVDRFCSSNSISHIDILKMDVQGWEMEVLKGASSMLANNRIRYIFSEVGFRRADSDMQHFADFNDYMEERGYWLCGFYDAFRWGEAKQFVGFANALYVNPAFCPESR